MVAAGRAFGGGGVGHWPGWRRLQRPVGPVLVVDALEAVELGLQLGEGGGGGLSGEPALQGLVEAFDLALGLRMAGMAVLLGDAEVGEQVLEAVAAAGEAGGVDRPVVGEGRLRQAVSARRWRGRW